MPVESPTPSDFVALARLLRPQGRKGELLADLLTDFPDQLGNADGVYLVAANAEAPVSDAPRITVESQWMPTGKNAGRIVLKLAGCDSISAAERLADMKLMLPTAERPALEPDTFYVSDLVGSTLFDRETPVGEVVDVEFATSPDGRTRLADAAPLLSVRLIGSLEEEGPLLVPFVRAHLLSVDTAAGKIVMALPPGLLNLPD
ncbi:MAG: ribosome maturation factor RimM [Acidobacteriota bacterium]|nr:ribosome maturation factor RimM [Acidobacteriota bacterium]